MHTLISRLFNPAKKSYFLFGPRGTGKSTWLKIYYPDGHFIDLLNPSELRLYQAHPERLVEVDFIVDGPDGLYAIEVKHAITIHEKDLTGLKSFCIDYPEATPIMLYRGYDKLKKNNILCLPIEQFLLELTPFKTLS